MSIGNRSVAAPHDADIVAERVEPTNPAAAMITVIFVIGVRVARGDGAADDGGAKQAGTDTPAVMEAMGFGGRGGGCDAAGDGKRGNGESGNLGLDRHHDLHPGDAVFVVRMHDWTEACRSRFATGAVKFR